ncbi:hypothetical protein BDV93DRAFT_437810, partial [Ceratobasidium sp. AG-I]
LQADTFEHSFAIRWLTGFIARGEEWDTYDTRSSALDRAAALLAACAGTSASGAISREFVFPISSTLSSPQSPITITIRDESLSVGDHTAVGLQTWGSAYVLGERVAKDPIGFGVHSNARVLEIGAGTGLLALLCGKLAGEEGEGDGGMIVATDYHPAVLSNLSSNVSTNFPNSQDDSPPVRVLPLDWSICVNGKPTTTLSHKPFDEPFDTIFGADVIYELSHATLVHGVVSRLLRKPSYDPTRASAHFHLIMPLRPTHADEATSVDRTFPRAEDVRAQKGGDGDEEVLAIVGTETYARSAGVGRADEVQYVYYRIGWV